MPIEIIEKKISKFKFNDYEVHVQTDMFEDGLLQQELSIYYGGVCVATVPAIGIPLKPALLRELADTIEDMQAEASIRK